MEINKPIALTLFAFELTEIEDTKDSTICVENINTQVESPHITVHTYVIDNCQLI